MVRLTLASGGICRRPQGQQARLAADPRGSGLCGSGLCSLAAVDSLAGVNAAPARAAHGGPCVRAWPQWTGAQRVVRRSRQSVQRRALRRVAEGERHDLERLAEAHLLGNNAAAHAALGVLTEQLAAHGPFHSSSLPGHERRRDCIVSHSGRRHAPLRRPNRREEGHDCSSAFWLSDGRLHGPPGVVPSQKVGESFLRYHLHSPHRVARFVLPSRLVFCRSCVFSSLVCSFLNPSCAL